MTRGEEDRSRRELVCVDLLHNRSTRLVLKCAVHQRPKELLDLTPRSPLPKHEGQMMKKRAASKSPRRVLKTLCAYIALGIP